jgi:predicted nucleic acid-binding protein
MRPLRVYLDTSVLGGCFDPEFEEHSRRIIDGVRSGTLVALLSELVLRELQPAPASVRELVASLRGDQVEMVPITADMASLRDAYLEAGVLESRWVNDATHVAAATVARADAIVSWNLRHIVRLDKIKAFNRINVLEGYGVLTILSPMEVFPNV